MKERLMTFRIPSEIDKEMEKIVLEEDTDKSKLMRELIVLGMREKRLVTALKFYSSGKITLWKAARISGISLWQMMEILRQRKIPMQYSEKDLREDLKALSE